jgi:hypothetical protein
MQMSAANLKMLRVGPDVDRSSVHRVVDASMLSAASCCPGPHVLVVVGKHAMHYITCMVLKDKSVKKLSAHARTADTQSSNCDAMGSPISVLSRVSQLNIRTRASHVDPGGGGSPSSSDSAGRPARNQDSNPCQ